MKDKTDVCLYLFILLIAISMSVGCWFFARWWNYKLSYQGFVEKDIHRILQEKGLIKELSNE